MKDLLKHLDVVTRMAEQHQRMLKQLEPLFGAGRMAEETMRPLLGAAPTYEDLGRRAACPGRSLSGGGEGSRG